MKRYIRTSDQSIIDTSMFQGTPFSNTTDMSYYDKVLTPNGLNYMQESRGCTGEIVLMTPADYFNECANRIFHHRYSVDYLMSSREDDLGPYAEYKEAMQNGAKFPMPVLDYTDDGQEGLHRMKVAGDLYGWDTLFPVLVVYKYNPKN